METPPLRVNGRTRPERWWPPLRDAGSFALGTFILVWQTVLESRDRPYLIAAGIACLGVSASGAAQRWLRRKVEE